MQHVEGEDKGSGIVDGVVLAAVLKLNPSTMYSVHCPCWLRADNPLSRRYLWDTQVATSRAEGTKAGESRCQWSKFTLASMTVAEDAEDADPDPKHRVRESFDEIADIIEREPEGLFR